MKKSFIGFFLLLILLTTYVPKFDLSKNFNNDLLISKALYDEIKIGEKYEEFKSHPIKGRREKIDLIRVFLD